jgi:hypothetical protein
MISTTKRTVVLTAVLCCLLFCSYALPAEPLNTPSSLRSAIEDMLDTYGTGYIESGDFLTRLRTVEFALISGGKNARAEFADLQREALLANPAVSGHPILFVVRNQYEKDHHNTATLFQTGEINTEKFKGLAALKTIDLVSGAVKVLLEAQDGVIRDPEVSVDGRRIVFSMRRNIEDDYHIYMIGSDGTNLKQLTFGPGISDIDPFFLADGDIGFSSSREPKYCMCNRHIMANLYRMGPDGSNIHQIAKSTLFEGHGSLMPDGRILYDRWEYVDRNFGDAQGLWAVNPDGTNQCVYWGNNTWSPGGVIDARVIPGTERALCIFTSCHDRPWGALALIDRRVGLDGAEPVARIWPPDAIALMDDPKKDKQKAYGYDNFTKVDPKYEDPYPLNDKYFLVSRSTGKGELDSKGAGDIEMGIYLVDVFGNEILLHVEKPGCFDPMPVLPRPRPPVLPTRRDYANEDGYFYVADVYKGTHMAGVERGDVKSLRVVESPEKRNWTQLDWKGQGAIAPAMNWHDFNNKRILGTAPVYEDGSAYFAVPSDKFVYFQLLDKDGMLVQSMRSGTLVQSGETTGCIGCHEDRKAAPPQLTNDVPMAMRREPSKLKDWYGESRLFNYSEEVQPVFDKHCIECHDYGKEAGKTLNLAGDSTNTFNTSYNELWRKKYINAIGAGSYEMKQPYAWGSRSSKLVDVIRKGHHDVNLDDESLDRIVTWIDINAPYYPDYDSAFPKNIAGRSPLSPAQLKRLGELTGLDFANLTAHNKNTGPQISFDRPELSPCLNELRKENGPEYKEALAIIENGKQTLQKTPRADMPGFKPGALDQQRQQKYAARQKIELTNRDAIKHNNKIFDNQP